MPKIKLRPKFAELHCGYWQLRIALRIISWVFFLAAFGATIQNRVYAQEGPFPNFDNALHNIGNIEVSVDNRGGIGNGYFVVEEEKTVHCIFPKGSYLQYLQFIQLWIGGVAGRDTLVSTGMYGSDSHHGELLPDVNDKAAIDYRSILRSSPYRHADAVSEQDFVCEFTDTITDPNLVSEDAYDGHPYKPLYVHIRQSSHAWSTEYAEDFVLVDYMVTNIGPQSIADMYIGFYIGGNTYHISEPDYMIEGQTVSGYCRTLEYPGDACHEIDSTNLAWHADVSGHPNIMREWDYKSPRSVMGLEILRPKNNKVRVNFNWWVAQMNNPDYNWGPRLVPTDDDPGREIGPYMGHPFGDRNRYYMLSHPEIDYDQLFTAVSHVEEGFLPPPAPHVAETIAQGCASVHLLSFGPYSLEPGDSVPFTVALICGEDFHVNPWDYDNYWDPYHPEIYCSKLDFSDLAKNSRWARAVYDNPGVDTDGDGYRGEYCWQYIWRDTTDYDPSDSFVVDSIRHYYTGDSIPDFRAMTPPPPPEVRVYPDFGKVTLRWNGQESENTPDYFSGTVDFEGYRVYYGQGDRASDFVLLASYDIDDYIVWQFDPDNINWRKISNSASHDSLKTLFGQDFDANDYYDEMHYFLDPHTSDILFFIRQDWNQSDLSNPRGIHKVYPNASPYDSSDITEDGWRRSYEYEYIIDGLEPSMPYWFAVTAFDYGSFQYDIGQLETSPTTNMVKAYPTAAADTVEHRGLGVMVYPNPYRITDRYAYSGYENRDRTRAACWSRRIHFSNLPKICTIRIFTVDGDLVREIKHYCPDGGPEAQHEEWNVISRNTQEITTGIYIWHVRSEMGDQIGKLVIIK